MGYDDDDGETNKKKGHKIMANWGKKVIGRYKKIEIKGGKEVPSKN